MGKVAGGKGEMHMSENAIVQVSLTAQTLAKASAVLARKGMSLADALRLTADRIAQEEDFPLPFTPDAAAQRISLTAPQDALDFLSAYGISPTHALQRGFIYARAQKALHTLNRSEIAIDAHNTSPRVLVSLEASPEALAFATANKLDLSGLFYVGVVAVSEEIPNDETERAMNSDDIVYKDKEEFYKAIGLDTW
jgi:antitoxin component of RelBE/YafQ-DinJ toxin-antitoxin module